MIFDEEIKDKENYLHLSTLARDTPGAPGAVQTLDDP